MEIFYLLVGAGLLFFGRRAFWLFVAAAGFLAGLSLANSLSQGSEWLGPVVGLVVGLLAAFLALAVQRFAISFAGFLVGGYIGIQTLSLLQMEGGWVTTVLAFLIGGILGIFIVGAFMGWALISLSSLLGAAMIVGALDMGAGLGALVFIVLVVVGVFFQGRDLRGAKT